MPEDSMTQEQAQTMIACLMLMRHTIDASIEGLMPVASKDDELFEGSFTIPNYQLVPDSILLTSFETIRRGDPAIIPKLLHDVAGSRIVGPLLRQIARFGPPLQVEEEDADEDSPIM